MNIFLCIVYATLWKCWVSMEAYNGFQVKARVQASHMYNPYHHRWLPPHPFNITNNQPICYIWKAHWSFMFHQLRVSPIEMVRNDWLDMVHTFKRIVEWFYLGFRMLQLVSLKFIYLWLHLFLKKMVSFLVFSATTMVVLSMDHLRITIM